MLRKLARSAAVAVLMLAVMAPYTGLGAPASQADLEAPIRLKAATFRPGLGQAPAIPPGLSIAGYAAGQRGYYIVQFAGPVNQSWKDQVTAAGAEILSYIPEFAFKVRMNPAQAQQVAALGSVSWVGVFHPAYKLSPRLSRADPALYTVRLEQGANAGLATAAVAASGAQVVHRSGEMLVVLASPAHVDAIAQVLDVAWVENFDLYEKHNEYGAGAIMGANVANASGYDGSTQTVAVADTGIGDGTKAGAHPDVPAARINAIYNWTSGNAGGCYRVFGDGSQDVDSGHGTHVALSVLGGGGPGGVGKGTAPAAKLVFQAVEDYVDFYGFCAPLYPDGYYLIGIPSDIRQLFQQAYDAGARIHSNSWGSNAMGDYTADSANADSFVWSNRDLTITFSAGNSGVDTNGDGVVDNDSTGSPATAKNVITVGASENDRQGNYQCDTGLTYTSRDAYQSGRTCSSMGGQNILGTWGSRYGFVGPMANDPTAGNAEQMAGWSSRGPTDDGRIKPDVVAPGTWILSGYSSLYQEGYGDPVNPRTGAFQWDGWGMPSNVAYKYMGGTSMSNPLAAGGAAVVRDFYEKAHGHGASAALVKATLINSAVDLQDENNDGADDNDFPIPNVHEGWGRVNLINATDGSHQFVDNATGVGTSSSATYQYNLGAAGSPFKVSLVWSDYPSTEAAAANLVNDLDLVVTAPGGAVYRGNVFSGGWSGTGGSPDRVNNVENVYVQSAAAGDWTVEVRGFNVPNGPQPFALVVDGAFGTLPTPTATSVAPTNTPVPPTPTATSVDPTNTPLPPTPTNTPLPPTPTSTPVAGTMHVGDLDDGGSVSEGRTWRGQVVVRVHDSGESPVSGAAVTGTWTANGDSTTATCTTNSSGACTVASGSIRKNIGSATFTVTNVTHAALTYSAGANHDPDGDSNGTAITVLKP